MTTPDPSKTPSRDAPRDDTLARRDRLDAAIALVMLVIPLAAHAPDTARGALAALAVLVGWFVLVRPTWAGLAGFYGTAALVCSAAGWSVYAWVWPALS